MRAEIIRRAKSGLLDDDELQLVITEQIEEDPSFWTGSGKTRTVINVEVNDGHVTLKGVVRSARRTPSRGHPRPRPRRGRCREPAPRDGRLFTRQAQARRRVSTARLGAGRVRI